MSGLVSEKKEDAPQPAPPLVERMSSGKASSKASSSKVSDYRDDSEEDTRSQDDEEEEEGSFLPLASPPASPRKSSVLGLLFGGGGQGASSSPKGSSPNRRASSLKMIFQRGGRRNTRMSEQPFSPADFERWRKIGSGGFGVVYLVRKVQDPGGLFAMKVLGKDLILKRGAGAKAKLERDVLRYVKHPFLVRLRYAFQTKTRLYLVTDYYAGGTLLEMLRKQQQREVDPDAAALRFYACELALALTHLHSKNVVHRDVKPSNVLVDREGHVALCDFGIASVVEACRQKQPIDEFVGTFVYMSPELIQKQSYYGAFVDWFALGVVLYELAFGKTPFDHGRGPRDTMKNILHQDPEFFPNSSDATFVAFVSALLDKSSETRLGDDGIFEHAFLAPLDAAAVLRKELKPPHVPVLPKYLSVDNNQGLTCLEKSTDLPALDDDGESVHENENDHHQRKDDNKITTRPRREVRKKKKNGPQLPPGAGAAAAAKKDLSQRRIPGDAFRGFSYAGRDVVASSSKRQLFGGSRAASTPTMASSSSTPAASPSNSKK